LKAFCQWAQERKNHLIALLDMPAKVVKIASEETKGRVTRQNIHQESIKDLNKWRQAQNVSLAIPPTYGEILF
jgi:hypothetical protein